MSGILFFIFASCHPLNQMSFKMVHSNTKKAKSRTHQYQVCSLRTTHSSALKVDWKSYFISFQSYLAIHKLQYTKIKIQYIHKVKDTLQRYDTIQCQGKPKKALKGCRMGRSDKVSLLYVTLLINTRFRFFYFRISNC